MDAAEADLPLLSTAARDCSRTSGLTLALGRARVLSMSLPELPQLEAFLAVASTLHFGAAAQQLHITQSTISHRIRQLEEHLGLQLFDRSRRRVALTPAGEAYRRRVSGLTLELQLAARDAEAAAQGTLGSLVIGYSGATAGTPLLDAVAATARASPQVRIELRRASLEAQIAGLLAAELDLGCTFLPLPANLSGLSVRTLPPIPVYVWLSRSHPLAGAAALSLDELRAERSVALSTRAEPGFSTFVRARGFPTAAASLEVDSLDACLGLIRRGIGVAVLPHTDLAPPDILRVPLREPIQGRCHLLWNEQTENASLWPLLRALEPTPSTP